MQFTVASPRSDANSGMICVTGEDQPINEHLYQGTMGRENGKRMLYNPSDETFGGDSYSNYQS